MRLPTLLTLTMLIVSTGCQSPPPSTAEMLKSSSGVERMRAVGRLAGENRWSNVPTFIRFLEDEDVSVRWAAVEALSAQVGADFGFRPADPAETRTVAVNRWKQWWQTEGRRGPQSRPPSAAS